MVIGITLDPDTSNNSATDTDAIVLPLPSLTLLDNFNRANATTLGASWIQQSTIRVNGNQAQSQSSAPLAFWAGAGTPFGAMQGASFTFVQTSGSPSSPVDDTSLLSEGERHDRDTDHLHAGPLQRGQRWGGRRRDHDQFRRLVHEPSHLRDGHVVDRRHPHGRRQRQRHRRRLAQRTYLGRSSAASGFTGTGRIGVRMPNNARIDNFSGKTLP